MSTSVVVHLAQLSMGHCMPYVYNPHQDMVDNSGAALEQKLQLQYATPTTTTSTTILLTPTTHTTLMMMKKRTAADDEKADDR